MPVIFIPKLGEVDLSKCRSLDLSNCDITTEIAKEIAQELKQNNSLVEINLNGNKLGFEGFMAILNAIKTNLSLTKVEMSCGSVETENYFEAKKQAEMAQHFCRKFRSMFKVSPPPYFQLIYTNKSPYILTFVQEQ